MPDDHDCAFLADLLPDSKIAFEGHTREAHGSDRGTAPVGKGRTPDAVVFAESTDDVAATLAAANDRGVPVTPYAAGTGLEGGVVPAHGGISLDLTRMDGVLDVRPEDRQVDVQAGTLGGDVTEAVAPHGFFFPPLPSSGAFSTIGGMIATDASGMQTVKYGEVGDWVLRVEAVLADGSTVSAGSRAKKTSAGYNLKDLLVGSEGTLAVVTEATLELAGRPAQVRGGRAIFEDLEGAATAVHDAVRSGVDVARIELLDPVAAMVTNEYLGTDLPDAPMVFVEFHADHGVEEEVAFCRSVFEAHGVERFEIGEEEGMAELWEARREVGTAMEHFDPEKVPLHPGDVTVPISRYPEIVRRARELAEEAELTVPLFGHGGDGNLHYSVVVDPDDEAAVERGERYYRRLVELAIELGGTSTGEHGVGVGKREYLVREHGEASVEAMRAIKRALDPRDTLNPGKIFPETIEGGRVGDPSREGDAAGSR